MLLQGGVHEPALRAVALEARSRGWRRRWARMPGCWQRRRAGCWRRARRRCPRSARSIVAMPELTLNTFEDVQELVRVVRERGVSVLVSYWPRIHITIHRVSPN